MSMCTLTTKSTTRQRAQKTFYGVVRSDLIGDAKRGAKATRYRVDSRRLWMHQSKYVKEVETSAQHGLDTAFNDWSYKKWYGTLPLGANECNKDH